MVPQTYLYPVCACTGVSCDSGTYYPTNLHRLEIYRRPTTSNASIPRYFAPIDYNTRFRTPGMPEGSKTSARKDKNTNFPKQRRIRHLGIWEEPTVRRNRFLGLQRCDYPINHPDCIRNF